MICPDCGLARAAEDVACPVCRSRRLNGRIRYTVIGFFLGLLGATMLLAGESASNWQGRLALLLPLATALVGLGLGIWRS